MKHIYIFIWKKNKLKIYKNIEILNLQYKIKKI